VALIKTYRRGRFHEGRRFPNPLPSPRNIPETSLEAKNLETKVKTAFSGGLIVSIREKQNPDQLFFAGS
jgi:hypothetical protein